MLRTELLCFVSNRTSHSLCDKWSSRIRPSNNFTEAVANIMPFISTANQVVNARNFPIKALIKDIIVLLSPTCNWVCDEMSLI